MAPAVTAGAWPQQQEPVVVVGARWQWREPSGSKHGAPEELWAMWKRVAKSQYDSKLSLKTHTSTSSSSPTREQCRGYLQELTTHCRHTPAADSACGSSPCPRQPPGACGIHGQTGCLEVLPGLALGHESGIGYRKHSTVLTPKCCKPLAEFDILVAVLLPRSSLSPAIVLHFCARDIVQPLTVFICSTQAP
ncbi:hypothetical protein Y1Q_0003973 [Alligator mississippiensis]|uniref:Uncharacterized protein n=1 Tax=Alligator mississippiensis TaxID=8496 RepID=A0A151PHG8_ALLMI|nr:hypothetical protein Y1Q_0003973 [Alligator mississippiensis]